MLTSISVSVTNCPERCAIKIISSAFATSIGSITGITISSRKNGTNAWTEVKSIAVSDISDIAFTLYDISVVSGTKYDYLVKVMGESTELESGIMSDVECKFYGTFIGNDITQYVCQFNQSTDTDRHIAVSYVSTLSGKYPYRVSNAELNYTTGKTSGVFLAIGSDNRPISDDYHMESQKVLDFLLDGTSKLIKTFDGLAWYVSIDSAKEVYNEFIGLNPLEINWTEIDSVPTSGMVIE